MTKNYTRTLIIFPILFFACFTLKAATYTVTSAVNGTTVDGVSLRWAITQANGGTGNTVAFNIPGASPHTITLTTALPVLSKANTTIDGRTQPANGFTGLSPKIIINGNGIAGDGINATDANFSIYNILIHNFAGDGIDITDINYLVQSCVISKNGGDGIKIDGNTGSIFGNLIGIDTTGTIGGAAYANTGYGIHVNGSSTGTTIGGTGASQPNTISNNVAGGIFGNGNSLIINGNIIGLNKSGTAILGNGSHGIHFTASNLCKIQWNTISANSGRGVWVDDFDDGDLFGNKIGTDINGTVAFGNASDGVYMGATNTNVEIGRGTATYGNLISNNGGYGIYALDFDGGLILGNTIGLDNTGTVAMGNTNHGIWLSAGSGTTAYRIGDNGANEGNIISSNGGSGIFLDNDADGSFVQANKIGTDITGTLNRGNTAYGIYYKDATSKNNLIGGTTAGEPNIIAYNGNYGILMDGASQNEIHRNSIFCNNQLVALVAGSAGGINLINNGNNLIAAPVITSANGSGASGTAPANATIELFYDDNCPYCEGKTYIATVTANGAGAWSYVGALTGNITATSTLAADGTSKFSSCVSAVIPCDPTQNGCAHVVYTLPLTSDRTYLVGGYWEPCYNTGKPGSGSTCGNGNAYAGVQTGKPTPAHIVVVVEHDTILDAESPNTPAAGKVVTYTGDTHATCPGTSGTVADKPHAVGNGTCAAATSVTFDYYLWVGPPTLGVSSQSNVNCSGSATGSATVTACGGTTSGVTYSWAPGGQTTTSVTGLTAGTYTVTLTLPSGCSSTLSVTITQPGSGVGSSITSQSNVNCNGSATGSATVTGTAGTPNYTYSWSPGGQTTSARTGLTAGTYSVTVTDNAGCTTKQIVTITQPATALSSGISAQNNVGCTGSATGSATITATGGTGAYTYSWSPGGQTTAARTGLTAGTYSVTVTDNNGCTSLQTVAITQPASAISSGISTQSNVGCTGSATGSATVTVTGGTGAYTYSWSPGGQTTSGRTGLTAGTYSVTVTDNNGCTSLQAVTITQPASVLTSTISGTQSNVGCTGSATGSATVTGVGGTPSYTYSWSPGGQTTAARTGLTAGTYSVTVTDNNGCTSMQTVNITQPASVLTSTITGTQVNVGCSGSATGSATVTGVGGTPSYTYSWSPGGQTTAARTGLTAGTYSVTVTDNNGCTLVQTVNITQPASVLTSTITGTQVNVGCSGSATGSATVTGVGGTPSYTYSWSPGGQTTAARTGLTAGTYSVTVTDNNGCTSLQTVNITQPASVLTSTITGTQVNVGCSGSATGSATVTGVGGTPAYTYSWSPGGQTTAGVSGLTAGTYNVTVTDNNGCTSLQAVNITQPASVLTSTIVGTQNNVGCTGSATGSATVTGVGGTPAYTYSWSPGGQTTAGVSGLTAGTYNITVTDNNGCTSLQTVNITQPASVLTSTIVGTQNNVGCTGSATGSATVTGIGGTPSYTYSWSPGGQTTAGLSGLTAGTYNVTVTDNNGCTSVQAVNITQPASVLTSTITGTQVNVGCTGAATGSATVTGIGGTPSYTYSWSPGGQTTAGLSGLTAGTYNVTVTDNNGCTSVQAVNITQPASSINSTTGSVNATCGNSNGTTSVTATGGTPGYTYSWSPVGGTNSTAVNLPAGPYSVTITDNNGCTKVDAVSVNNSGAPTVGISSQTDVLCNGSGTGSATITTSGGTGTLTYLWSPGGQTTTTVTGLTAGTYIVTVTDANNCAQGQTITITQPATAVNAGISAQTDVSCKGTPTGVATVTATGGTGTLTYNWSPGGATTTTINGLTAGTYSVTVTDANGCSQQQSVTITEPAAVLSSGISSQNNVNCTGSATGSATITVTGGTTTYTYNWSTGETTNTITGLTAGTYSVTVTDAKGCSEQQVVNITQPASNVTVISGSTNAACGSTNGTVSVTASGGTPGYTYNWSNGGTTSLITGLTAATYSVTITDNKGCTKNTTVIVAGSPGPSINLNSSNNVTCNGLNNGTATLTTTSGTLPYIYTWTPNVTTTNTANNLSANTYTVVVSDSAGCKDTVVFNITEPLPMTFTLSASNATICAGESLTLLTSTPSGGTAPFTFNWLPSGPVVNPLVPTTYSVTVMDSSGCVSQMDTIRVIPLPVPIANFDTVSSGRFGQNYTFTDLSTGGYTWYWDFGDGTISSLQNPVHMYKGAGTYTVTQIVTGASGCPDTITKIVIIYPDIIIPNVFTPNHDGVNDDFWIPNTGFETFELTIYDRWGLKLFVTNSGEIRWDGRTSAGEEVPDGTYYYLLNAVLKTELQGKKYESKGFINLIRSGGK